VSGIAAPTTATVLNRAAQSFRRLHPDFRLDLTESGSSASPPALIADRTRLAAMSREMTEGEVAAFTAKHGYPPTGIPVAQGAIAIFVHRDNPLSGLTRDDLRRVFSRSAASGRDPVDQWGELGLTGDWAKRSITLYGVGEALGETKLLRAWVMRDAHLSAAMLVQPTQSSAVQAVAADLSGIAYASLLFRCRAVRALPLAGEDGVFYPCDAPNCRADRYPLARKLLVYVNKPPGRAFDAPTAEFLKFVLCREGQQIMMDCGIFSLDLPEISRATRTLER
jgi:phosphate transport system substrate-binding protein